MADEPKKHPEPPKLPDIERRVVPASEFRVEKRDDGTEHMVGYAAVFNKHSLDLGGFVETIKHGAFDDVLAKSPDVRSLFNHDPNLILGRTTAGTLDIKADKKGLWTDTDLPDTQPGRDLRVSMARGDVDQMSFAFTIGQDGDTWDMDDDERWIRTISKVAGLFDISAVTYPAYPDTSVALRSLEAARARITKLEATQPDPEGDGKLWRVKVEYDTDERARAEEETKVDITPEPNTEPDRHAELADPGTDAKEIDSDAAAKRKALLKAADDEHEAILRQDIADAIAARRSRSKDRQ